MDLNVRTKKGSGHLHPTPFWIEHQPPTTNHLPHFRCKPLESTRALSSAQRISRRMLRQNSQPHELRAELVADVDRLCRRGLEIHVHERHGVTGARAHSSRRV